MKKRFRWWISLMLTVLMVLFSVAYAEADMTTNDAICSDIVAGIDRDSIVIDGESTFFSSVMADGTQVRFEGKNITVDEDGITIKPEGSIVSLDSVGEIYEYYAIVKDGAEAPVSEQWMDIGYGYTNSAERISVDCADEVYGDALMGWPCNAWNGEASLSVADIVPNFVFVKCSGGNTMDITVTSLTIGYNPLEKYTDIEVPRRVLPDYFTDFEQFFEMVAVAFEEPEVYDIPMETGEAFDAGEQPEADGGEGGWIYSDIIAGIDPDSVMTEGDATFFSAIMSDGTEIRFQGTNISINADGIVLMPEGSITSLDAVGKIYLYQATVKDGMNAPASEQVLDVGYGYTFSPDHVNMGSASDVFTASCYGYPAQVWNQGVSIVMDDYQPNFVFVSGSSTNTEALTLTGLTIGYDPTEKYTDLEAMRATIPDYVYTQLKAEADVIANASVAEPVDDDYIDINTLAEMKMAQNGGIYSDVIAGIDYSSIRQEGDVTFFSAAMSDGTIVRFEGTDIVIDADGLTMQPESRVTALDAVGKIYLYRAQIKDGTTEPVSKQWLSVGGGYAFDPEKTSVERADEVSANGISGLSSAVWNDDCMASMVDYEPNFIFFNAQDANTTAITLTSLVVGYQPDEKYTAIAEISGYMPESSNSGLQEPVEESLDVFTQAEIKMAESGSIYSDIVAGIDRESIAVDGDTTFFSAVMSDGTTVRFEGTNIAISDEGIVINPSSEVTSLDSVGKIYCYNAAIKDNTVAPVSQQFLFVGGGYTFSGEKTGVAQAADVYTFASSGYQAEVWSDANGVSVAFDEPNFVHFEGWFTNTEPFTLTSLTIGYNPSEKVTAFTAAKLNTDYYQGYIDGAPYALYKEDKADEANSVFDFYLLLKQEILDSVDIEDKDWWWKAFLPKAFYETGDLKDADGNVLDKTTAHVHEGYTLDVIVGDYTLTVDLPMADLYEDAQTFKDARPYSTMSALGRQNTLVIPVVWSDQTDLVSDELYALYQKALGRIIDEQGNLIDDYSDGEDEAFSLSEYFDTASYGKLEIASFMTDWYYTDKTFADDYEFIFPEIDFADEVLQWYKSTYPDTDWKQFDQDADGYVDSIIFISVGQRQGTAYVPASFGGAVHSTATRSSDRAGTPDDPQANCFLTVNHAFLADGETGTMIHEFSHNLGLNDYYDGSYSGISAVGGYDMEDSNVGDWNAYSKLAVGWMDPQVVTDLASGESVELTIGSLALTDDVILLPAAGTEYNGPFGEYVMIDLLTPDGVNAYDAEEYGLEDTVGVRISHVNGYLQQVTEMDDTIGMELYSNNYEEGGFGIYNIEVIQSGGENTLTNLENVTDARLNAEDLFYAGDIFTAEAYDEFFYQGLMDDGSPLGYTVEILSIDDVEGDPSATIRITAK